MRCLILAPFHEGCIARLEKMGEVVYEPWTKTNSFQDPELLGRRLKDERFDAVVVEADFLFVETFEAAPNTRFAGVCRTALNHIDLDAATHLGVAVVNTPGRNAPAVAELTIALMLAVIRRVTEADRFVKNRLWESPTFAYLNMRGRELNSSVVGIIGLGAVGRKTALLCAALGAETLGFDPFVKQSEITKLGIKPVDMDTLVKTSDIISLHAPDSAGLLMSAERIAAMRKGAALINTASPSLVDETALIKSLSNGDIAAGLDVFSSHPIEESSPLLNLPNATITPHIGGATYDVVRRHSEMMTNDLERFFRGVRPVNLVNPQVWE